MLPPFFYFAYITRVRYNQQVLNKQTMKLFGVILVTLLFCLGNSALAHTGHPAPAEAEAFLHYFSPIHLIPMGLVIGMIVYFLFKKSSCSSKS
jgi:hypothetical protein